jgi:hypothetical protein
MKKLNNYKSEFKQSKIAQLLIVALLTVCYMIYEFREYRL